MVYEMLHGRRAFHGSTTAILDAKQRVDKLVPTGVASELAAIVGRATAYDPAARFGTAAELRRALEPWGDRQRVSAIHIEHGVRVDEQLVVLPPPLAADDNVDTLYIAEGVHERLIRHLARRPMMRVTPRASAADGAALVIALHAGRTLRVELSRREAPAMAFEIPLAMESIDAAVEGASALVTAAFAGRSVAADPRALEVDSILLHARHIVTRDATQTGNALAMLERAAALAPGDARIAAARASLETRKAFFFGELDERALERAAELAQRAIAADPNLAEAHVAMGHVELHAGSASVAAGHFRVAIACSRHVPEAHDQLGMLLLEAGHTDAAMARFADALAFLPSSYNMRWALARSHALEGNWSAYDQVVGELVASGRDQLFTRARIAWWRGDTSYTALLDALVKYRQVIGPPMMEDLVLTLADLNWASRGDRLAAAVRASTTPDLRRRAYMGQLVAEVAGATGQVDASIAMIRFAIDHGLFDLPWLDRCPLLARARESAELAPLRAIVKARADAIFDALYGDHEVQRGTAATMLAETRGETLAGTRA